MAIGVEAAVEAVEIEAFADKIPSLIPTSNTFYNLAKDRFTKKPVSNITEGGSTPRPSFRVPFRAQGGAAIVQGTGNGDSFGTGNASQWQSFVLSPVFHYAVNQTTHLAMLATEGKQRGLINLKAEELKNSFDSAMAGLEGVMYGDSSGAITQIPVGSTISSSSGTLNATSFISGGRAMAFTDNQIIQIFPSEGGTARGVATISVNQPETSTLWFSTALPAGTAVGDYIMISGSSGVLGQGVYGTTAWQNSATAGTIAGQNRANFPGRISTPSINLAGGSITASLSQRIEALLGRAMGADNKAKDSGVYLFTEGQSYAQATTTYYNKQINVQPSNDSGNSGKVPDVSKKYFSGTFGSHEVKVSFAQPLGRIDLLLTDTWSIGELVPLQLFKFGDGSTFASVPASGGGWTSGFQFIYEAGFNLANSAPRLGAYVYGASEPTI